MSGLQLSMGLRISTDEFIVKFILPQLEAIKKESEADDK
jgi:hypothetical protein